MLVPWLFVYIIGIGRFVHKWNTNAGFCVKTVYIFSAYIGSFIIVIIQYTEEGELDDQVFNPLFTGIVFNCIWLLVQSVFKEVKLEERSTSHLLLLRTSEMPTAQAEPETMV